jgi:hypothetical protein
VWTFTIDQHTLIGFADHMSESRTAFHMCHMNRTLTGLNAAIAVCLCDCSCARMRSKAEGHREAAQVDNSENGQKEGILPAISKVSIRRTALSTAKVVSWEGRYPSRPSPCHSAWCRCPVQLPHSAPPCVNRWRVTWRRTTS